MQELNDNREKSAILLNIGIVNMENKNYDPAAEKFVEALKL
ncbi:MAG TPA: hypothetical protein VIP29_03015 [Nitrososphaeraceae archaeon]